MSPYARCVLAVSGECLHLVWSRTRMTSHHPPRPHSPGCSISLSYKVQLTNTELHVRWMHLLWKAFHIVPSLPSYDMLYMTRSVEVLPQTAHSVFSAVPSKWSQKWFSDQGPATFVLRPALLFCCFSLWVIFQNNWDRKIFEFDHWRPRGGEGARCIVPS